jgi:hypothetical protein
MKYEVIRWNKENCNKAKLHDLYYSFNIAGISKSLAMKWVGHKAYMVKKTNDDNVLVILVKKNLQQKDHSKNFRCK